MATFIEYQQVRAGAEAACAELIAGIQGKVTGEERVAVACALARAATEFKRPPWSSTGWPKAWWGQKAA